MLKELRNIEKKLYETIGIKTFRKMAFCLYKILAMPILIFLSKEDRQEYLTLPNNYNMKKGNGIQDLKDFKKWLLFNASFHTWGLYRCIKHITAMILGSTAIGYQILMIMPILINVYCILLQRYNLIRIHEAEEKYERLQELRYKRMEKIIRKSENELSVERINELIDLLNASYNDSLSKQGYSKVVAAKPCFINPQTNESSNIDYQLIQNQGKILKMKLN